MRLIKIIIIFTICLFPIQSILSVGWYPKDQIKEIEIVDLMPAGSVPYEEFRQSDFKAQKKHSGIWSTMNQLGLDYLSIKTSATSELPGNYKSANLFDGKIDTAWVEGAKGNGIGEWVYIELDAIKESVTTTPFAIWQIGVVPGYAKSEKTWLENNRVKTAFIIIHSPSAYANKNEWTLFRVHLDDISKLQLFDIPSENASANDCPMKKEIWFKIESVYPGNKYQDTCISELVFAGSSTS